MVSSTTQKTQSKDICHSCPKVNTCSGIHSFSKPQKKKTNYKNKNINKNKNKDLWLKAKHPIGWIPMKKGSNFMHYMAVGGQCGQSCPCCRAAAGDILGACPYCRKFHNKS
jgi:hypothetical protein